MSAQPWPNLDEDGKSIDPPWDLRREGRAWRDEAWSRYMLVTHKVEMVDGKLLGCAEDREIMLGLLLENVGADRAIRFGNLDVWRAALATASTEKS